MPAVTITNLRCEYLTDPAGIDDKNPRLSWELASTRRNVVQTAYRILVATDPALLKKNKGSFWDSGRVRSNRTGQIVYKGKTLRSYRQYFWKVLVWTGDGKKPSAVSGTASWGMGILDQKQWKGQWIGYPVAGLHDSPYLRIEIRLGKKVKRAVLYATARGLYEASINGQRVGEDLFAPGWTDYHKRLYYNAYDVTPLLKKGRNALGAVLGPGWYKGPIAWENRQLSYGRHMLFLANLRVEFTDGTSTVFATDKTWKSSNGPILQSTFLWGETFDRRRDMPGWDRTGFDDTGWQPVTTLPVEERKPDPGKVPLLQAYPNEPVRRHEKIPPLKVWQAPRGSWIFDLGGNFAGRAILKVKEKAGTVVRMRFGEMVNDDKTLYVENLRTAVSTDIYICSGGKTEIWEPSFTFHGFRYVEVTGITRKPSKDMITGVVISSDTPRTGRFHCSNAMVNTLYANSVRTQRANFIDVPTDCPQRDERLGWTGDAQVYIRTAAANMDVAAFFKKWLRDLEDTQKPDGAVVNVAPAVVIKDLNADAGWGDAMVICPWVMYTVYGDTAFLRTHYGAMRKWIAYLKSTSDHLIRKKTHTFGDWLSINAVTPKEVVQTAFFAYAVDLTARTARVLKKYGDARKYERLHGGIKKAFCRAMVSADGRVKGNTQTAYVLALHFDLLPERLRGKAAKHLVADIRRKGNHLSTGFLGTPYLLHVLRRFGYADVAYTLLTNTTYPGWGYSVVNGATSIWERWNGYTKEHGFGDTNMNSFSHYAYGSVTEWLFNTVAGIDCAAPGFGEIIIRPLPGGGITSAAAEYKSMAGPVKTAWSVKRKTITLDVSIPANTRARIHVPTSDPGSVMEGGAPVTESDGLTREAYSENALVLEAGSGTYRFRARI